MPDESIVPDVDGWFGVAAGPRRQRRRHADSSTTCSASSSTRFVHRASRPRPLTRALGDRRAPWPTVRAADDGEPSNGIWELRRTVRPRCRPTSAAGSPSTAPCSSVDRPSSAGASRRRVEEGPREVARSGARRNPPRRHAPPDVRRRPHRRVGVADRDVRLAAGRATRAPHGSSTPPCAALGSGPLLYRYPPDGSDGFSAGEAPFVPASWWAVTALAVLGRPRGVRPRRRAVPDVAHAPARGVRPRAGERPSATSPSCGRTRSAPGRSSSSTGNAARCAVCGVGCHGDPDASALDGDRPPHIRHAADCRR